MDGYKNDKVISSVKLHVYLVTSMLFVTSVYSDEITKLQAIKITYFKYRKTSLAPNGIRMINNLILCNL